MNDRNQKVIRSKSASSQEPGVGTVASIASGLSEVLARPYLLIVPLILDLILWLGVQISIKPFTEPFARLMQKDGGANGPDAAKEILKLGEHVHLNEAAALFVPSIFAGLSKENALNWLISLMAPPLAKGIDRNAVFSGFGNGPIGVWNPPHWFAVLSLGVGLLVIATLILVVFRVPVARVIASRSGSASGILREMGWAWIRLLGLLGLAGLAIMGIFLPILLVAAVLLLFGVNLAVLVAFGLVAIGGMVAVYTLFVLDAMLLLRIGPISAIQTSVSLVRGRFGECFRFALTCVLIQTGLLHVWQVLVQNPPGFFIALLANAFVGTGIAAATMIFFSDRLRLMEPGKSPRSRSRPLVGTSRSR